MLNLNQRDLPVSNKTELSNDKQIPINPTDLDNKVRSNEESKNLRETKNPTQTTNNIPQNGVQKLERVVEKENNFLFYNSLSLIMLSMLAAGLVGVVFILYFTFRKEYYYLTEEL
jgi:hypothetical protein